MDTPSGARRLSSWPGTPLWIIAVMLAFIAGTLWTGAGNSSAGLALAQVGQLAGARGVYAFAGQIDRTRHGLYMLDIEQGTIWCYALESENAVTKFRLIAGRSWIYDRYLRDFNCASPSVGEIQRLVALQREMTPVTTTQPQQAELEPGPARRETP